MIATLLGALASVQATTTSQMAAPVPKRGTVHKLSDEDIEFHLNNWARWHRGSYAGQLRQLWYPSRASGRMGVSGATTFEEMCDGVDMDTARAMNAVIEDLPVIKRALLHHLYLQSVYRFPRVVSLETEYAETLPLLRVGMLRKGIFV